MTSQPCSCRALKGPFVLCRLQSDAPPELRASLPIRSPARFTTSSSRQIGAHVFVPRRAVRSLAAFKQQHLHHTGYTFGSGYCNSLQNVSSGPQLSDKCLGCGCTTCPVITESNTNCRIHLDQFNVAIIPV